MLATKPSATPISLSLPGYTHPVSKKMHNWHKFTYYAFHGWEKLVIILLALNAIQAVYEAIQFMLTDYQTLQLHFSQNTVNTSQVTALLHEGIEVMLDSILNIVMAARLSLSQERVSRILELVFATALLIWPQEIIHFLQSVTYTFFN